jgi:hypothetical protein
VTTTTTLTSTLLVLGGWGALGIVKLIGLVLNMFCTSVFFGQSIVQWLALEHIIQGYWIGI